MKQWAVTDNVGIAHSRDVLMGEEEEMWSNNPTDAQCLVKKAWLLLIYRTDFLRRLGKDLVFFLFHVFPPEMQILRTFLQENVFVHVRNIDSAFQRKKQVLHGGIKMLALGFSVTVSQKAIPFFLPSPP